MVILPVIAIKIGIFKDSKFPVFVDTLFPEFSGIFFLNADKCSFNFELRDAG